MAIDFSSLRSYLCTIAVDIMRLMMCILASLIVARLGCRLDLYKIFQSVMHLFSWSCLKFNQIYAIIFLNFPNMFYISERLFLFTFAGISSEDLIFQRLGDANRRYISIPVSSLIWNLSGITKNQNKTKIVFAFINLL